MSIFSIFGLVDALLILFSIICIPFSLVKEKRGDKKAAAVSATVGTIVCVAALILSVTGFIANVATLVVNCMKL